MQDYQKKTKKQKCLTWVGFQYIMCISLYFTIFKLSPSTEEKENAMFILQEEGGGWGGGGGGGGGGGTFGRH